MSLIQIIDIYYIYKYKLHYIDYNIIFEFKFRFAY